MGDLLNFDAEMEALFEEKPFPRRGDYCIRIYALSELTSLETFARLRTCVKTLDEKDPPDKTMVTLSGMSGGALQFLLDKGSSWVDIVSREQGGKGDLVAEIGDLVPDPSTGKTSYTRAQKPKRSKSGSPNARAGDRKLQLLGESTSSSKRAVTPPRAESGPPAEQASASGTAADQMTDDADLETNKTEPSYSTMTQQDQEEGAEDVEDASAAPGQADSSGRGPGSGSAASPATEGDSTTLPGTDSPKKGRGKASLMARGRSNSTNLLAMSENPGVDTFEDLPQEHVEKALSEKSSRIAKKPTKIPKEEQLRRAIRDMNYSGDLFWNRSLSPKARQRDRILRGKEELDYEKPGIKFGIFPKVKKSLARPLQPRGILKAPTGLKDDLQADIEEPAIGEEQDHGPRRQPFGGSSFGGMGSFGGAGAAKPFVADDEEELELLRKQHAEAAERSRQKDLQRQETERLRLEADEAEMDLAKKKAREAILAKQTKELPKAKAPEPPAPTAGAVGAPSVAFDIDEKDSDAEAAAAPGDGAKKKDLRSLEAISRDDTPEVDDDSLAEQLWETPDLHADWTAEKADETIKEFDKLKAQPLFNVDVMCLGVHEFHHGLSNLEKCIETYLSNTTHSSTSVLLNSNVRAREGGLFDSPLNVLPKYHVVNVGKQKEKFRIGFMGLLTPDTRHCALSQEVAKQSAVTLTATSTTPAVRMMVTGATPLSGNKKKKLLGVGTSGELTSGSSPATSGFAIAAGGEDISSSEKMPEVGGAAGRGAFGGGKRRMLLQRSSSTLHVEDHLGVAGPMPYIQQDGEVFGATAFRKPDTEEEGADDDQQGTSASPATRQSRLKLREDGTTPGVFWLPENADINRSGRPRGGRDGDRPLAVQDVSQSPPLRAARGEPAGPVQLPRLGDRPAEPSSSTSSFVNPQEAPMEAGDLPQITIGSGTPPPGSVEDQQDEHENSSSRAERRGRRPSSAGSGSGGSFADAAAVSSPAAATRAAGGNKSPKKGMMASLRSGSSLSLELDEPVDLPAAEEDELPKRKPRGGFATLRSGSSLSMDEPLDVEVQEVDQEQASDERTTTGQENYKKKAGKPALASLRSGSSVSLDDPQDFPLEKDDDATSLTDRQSQEITDGGAVEVPFEFGPSAATEAADQFNLTPTSATWAFPKRRTGSRGMSFARGRSGSSILDDPYDEEVGDASHAPSRTKKSRIGKIDEEPEKENDPGEQEKSDEGGSAGGASGRRKSIEWASDVEFGSDHEDLTAKGRAASSAAQRKKFTAVRSGSSLLDQPYDIEVGKTGASTLNVIYPAHPQEQPGGAATKAAALPLSMSSPKRRMFGTGATRSGSSLALDEAFDEEVDERNAMPATKNVEVHPVGGAAAQRRSMMARRRSGSSILDEPYSVEIGPGILKKPTTEGDQVGGENPSTFDFDGDGGAAARGAMSKKRGSFKQRRSDSSLQFDEPYEIEIEAREEPQGGFGKRGAMAARARSGSSIQDDAFDIELDDEDQDVVEAPKLSAAAKRRGSFVGRKSGSSLQFDDPYDVEVGGPLGRAGSFGSKRGAMLRARSGSSTMLDDPFDVEVDEDDDDKDRIKPQVGGPQPPLAGAKRRGAFGGRRSGSSLQFDDDVEFGEAAPRLGGLGAGKRGAMAARARSGSSILDDAFDIELEAQQEDDEDKAGDDGLVLGGPTTRASSASPPIATGASAGAKKRRSFSGLRSGTSTLANIDEESEPSAEGGSGESAVVAAKRKTMRVSRSIEWSQDVVFGDDDDDEANAPFSGGQKPGGKRGAFAGGMRSTSSLQLDEPYEVEVQPRKKEFSSGDEKRFGMARRRSGSTLRLQATIDEERAAGEEEDEDESPLDAIAAGHTKRAATLKPSRSIEWAADVRFGAAGDEDETEPLASSAHAQAKRGRLLAARSGSSLLDEAYDVDLDVEQELELEKAASSKPRFGGPTTPKQRAGGAFRAMRSGSSILDIAYDEEVDEDVAGPAARTGLAPVQPDARAAQRRRMRAMRSGSSITLDDAFDEDLEGIRSEMKANLAGVDFFPVEEVTEMRSILKKTQPIPERDLEKESDSMSQVTFDITATAAERLGESQSSRPAVRRSLGSSTGFGDRLKSSDTLGVDTVVTVSGHTDAERSGSATGSRTGEQENSASTATGDYESILEFQEPRAAANEVVGTALKRLSAVDAVVALTHQSNAEDKELMRTEPDIDLLLGGFEREPLEWYVDAHGKHLGREWDPVEQRFTSIAGPDRLAVKAGPDAVSVIDLWLVPDGDECLMEDPPNPPYEDSDVENMQRDADLVGLENDARILKKMNRFPTVTSRSPRWKEQRDQPSRTGRRLVVGRHRHLRLTPHRANLKENDEKGFEPDQEFAKVLQKYQKLLNLEDMNLLNFADFDTRLEQIAGLEASKYDNMRRKALDAYISYVKKMEQKRKLGRDTTEEEVKALKNVDNVLDAGRPSVDPDSLCSGVERGLKRPCWTTRDAEWRQITFHSLMADLVLPEVVGSAAARRKTLLLLPAIHYLSSYAENGGGRDYGLEDPRFTRKELLVEFIPPLRGFSNGDDDDPDPEPNRPPDLSKQKKAELRLVKLTVSGHDLLRLLYESETFLRGTNSYLQFDHSAILLNDFQDLNLPKISEKELKKNKFPGYPGKKRGGPGGRGSGEDGQSVAQSTLGGDETGESTLLWREERDRIEEEARLEAVEEVEREQVEEAIDCVMQVARADRMDAAGGVLAFPVSGASSEVSGYDPDERVDGEDEGGDEEEQSYHSASGSEKGEEEDDEEEDRGSGVGSGRSAKKDADNESLFLSSTETDVFDPNEPIKTKVPSDFQILTVFGETFDRSAFYTIVVPGSLLLTETAKPGDHRLEQPLIAGGQRKRRPRKSDPESSANDTSSEDEDEKRRRYNAAPPVRDQVYNLLKDVVAPLQLGGAHAVKPIVDNAPLLVELALKNLLKDTWQLLSPFWSSQKKFALGGLKPPPGEFDDDKNLPAIVRMQRRLNLIQTLQRGGKLREIEDPMQVRDDKLMLEKMVNLLDTQSTPLDLEKALEKFQEELLEAEVDKRLFKRAQHERLPSPMSRWAIARQEANLSEGSSEEEESDERSDKSEEKDGAATEMDEDKKSVASGAAGSAQGAAKSDSHSKDDSASVDKALSDSMSLKGSDRTPSSTSRATPLVVGSGLGAVAGAMSKFRSTTGASSHSGGSGSSTFGKIGEKGASGSGNGADVRDSAQDPTRSARSRRSGASSSRFSAEDELGRIEEEQEMIASRKNSKESIDSKATSAVTKTSRVDAGAASATVKTATDDDSHSKDGSSHSKSTEQKPSTSGGRSTSEKRKSKSSRKSSSSADLNKYKGVEWGGRLIAKSLSPDRERKRRDKTMDEEAFCDLETQMLLAQKQMRLEKKTNMGKYYVPEKVERRKLGVHLGVNYLSSSLGAADPNPQPAQGFASPRLPVPMFTAGRTTVAPSTPLSGSFAASAGGPVLSRGVAPATPAARPLSAGGAHPLGTTSALTASGGLFGARAGGSPTPFAGVIGGSLASMSTVAKLKRTKSAGSQRMKPPPPQWTAGTHLDARGRWTGFDPVDEFVFEMQKKADGGKLARHYAFGMPLQSGSETEAERIRERADPVMSGSELEF
eukprot:g1580.t1